MNITTAMITSSFHLYVGSSHNIHMIHFLHRYIFICFIPFMGTMNSTNWPAPNIWVFIAQLVEHCSANTESMGSNPVEAPKTFFRLTLRFLKSQSQLRWSHLHFILMSAVHIIFISNNSVSLWSVVRTTHFNINLTVVGSDTHFLNQNMTFMLFLHNCQFSPCTFFTVIDVIMFATMMMIILCAMQKHSISLALYYCATWSSTHVRQEISLAGITIVPISFSRDKRDIF